MFVTERAIELSAAVMVFNGKATLGRCLDALAFCDEVCVVDDVSTDGTWELLKQRPHVKSVQHRHETFASQRELAKGMCRGKWVLTLDADEYVTPAMAEAIRQAIRRNDAPDGFFVAIRSPYPGTLRGAHIGWHPRLVRADRCRWVKTDDPHSPLDMAGLRFERLGGAHIDHEPIPDLAAAMRKSINRSAILATQAHARGQRAGIAKLLLSPLARFFKLYFGGGGWRYGRDGIVFSALVGFEAFAKYALLVAPPSAGTAAPDGGPGSYPEGAPLAEHDRGQKLSGSRSGR